MCVPVAWVKVRQEILILVCEMLRDGVEKTKVQEDLMPYCVCLVWAAKVQI